MKKIMIILISTFLLSCNYHSGTNNTGKKETTKTSQVKIKESKGYQLMVSKCFICHLPKPDPAKMNQMIAPPMMRVKAHYLPEYSDKKSFVQAVMAIVKNPSEKNTLMPGAVKKFHVMPKLVYNDQDLKLIIETIYDYQFGSTPNSRMQMMGKLKLNNGHRWKLKKETMEKVNVIINKLSGFKSDKIKDYNQFGKELFNDAKFILLDKSYTGEKFNQIHNFVNGVEDDMHALIAEKSVNEAKKTVLDIKTKFAKFHNFFEAE